MVVFVADGVIFVVTGMDRVIFPGVTGVVVSTGARM
jgi:hypothetical protein